MATTRKTRDLCQTDWLADNDGEYFPNVTRYGDCAACGEAATLVARSTVDVNPPRDALRRAVANGKPIDWDTIAPPRDRAFGHYGAGRNGAPVRQYPVKCRATYPGAATLAGRPIRCESSAGHAGQHGNAFAARYWDIGR